MVERLSQENDFSGVDQIPQDTMTELDTMMKDNFVAIGENMKICDAFVKSGQSYIYVYSGDKIGTAIFYETLWDGAEEAVKELALQIIAMNPEYLDMDSISWDIKDQLRQNLQQRCKIAENQPISSTVSSLAKFKKSLVRSLLWNSHFSKTSPKSQRYRRKQSQSYIFCQNRFLISHYISIQNSLATTHKYRYKIDTKYKKLLSS